jgi:mono/diheme cytochrome c family protein
LLNYEGVDWQTSVQSTWQAQLASTSLTGVSDKLNEPIRESGQGDHMHGNQYLRRTGMALATVSVFIVALCSISKSDAGFRLRRRSRCNPCDVDSNPLLVGPTGGTWYWSRSPEEEKAVAASLFNRYCIRCHGVDGRGVWDIPGIPNFTNVRYQSSRSDDQLARAIMQGRGAVMPPFRGVLTLEESWALARYVRSLIPGTEISRPDDNEPAKAVPQPAPELPPEGTAIPEPPK